MKIIFLFPGYGAQFVGMSKGLYDDFRIVQEYFEEASNCLSYNFVKLCFASSEVELGRLEHAYPSLFLVSSAIAQLLKQQGIHPDAVAGYNIGEYAAIHTARGLTFPDGLYLLSKYGAFYQEVFAQSMVSGLRVTGLSQKMVAKLCKEGSQTGKKVYVAAHEQENMHVIMGSVAGIDKVRELVRAQPGAKIEDVPMEFGLYSQLMDPVVAQYKIYMEKVDFKDLEVPLYANVDAQPITRANQVKEGLVAQLTHTIQWHDIVAALDEYDLVVQVGPGVAIEKMVKLLYPEKQCIAINTKSDIELLKQIMGI